ncbi:MAG: ComF family protein [Candidatus Saccharicenans sp.]
MSIKQIFGLVTSPLKSVIFPSTCKICGKFLEGEEKVVCADCLSRAEIHRGEACQVCGRFFYFKEGTSFVCHECLKEPPPFTRHRAVGSYSGILKQMIILFKYRQHESLKRPLTRLMRRSPEIQRLFEGLDLVIPVPLHPTRLKERGFNQAELLAEEISREVGIPVARKVLIKRRKTLSQVSLEAEERKHNLSGAFSVRKAEKIAGKVILLVDDVFTTGSTCRECSRVLLEFGAKEVRVLTLARA